MNHFLSLNLLLHYLTFYQSANDNWIKFIFLNAAIIIFCLVYSLNIPHSTQNPWFFPLEITLTIHFFKIHISATFHIWHFISGSDNFEKIILSFYFVWWQKCKLHSFVYRFQTLKPNSIEYLRFINCYGKANKKLISCMMKHDWSSIVC